METIRIDLTEQQHRILVMLMTKRDKMQKEVEVLSAVLGTAQMGLQTAATTYQDVANEYALDKNPDIDLKAITGSEVGHDKNGHYLKLIPPPKPEQPIDPNAQPEQPIEG